MMTAFASNLVFSQSPQGMTQPRAMFTKNNASVQTLTLIERESRQIFQFDNTVKSEIIVGRADKIANYKPTLDLASLGAYRLGVSRLHISLVIEHNSVTVIDLQSANGTHINDTRLTAYKPYPLQTGDVIRLGNLILDVTLA